MAFYCTCYNNALFPKLFKSLQDTPVASFTTAALLVAGKSFGNFDCENKHTQAHSPQLNLIYFGVYVSRIILLVSKF